MRMHHNILLSLIMLFCLLAMDRSAFAAVTLPLAPQDRHQVFVWYMVCYSESIDFYKQEIELAQRHGIDGFLLDCGEWMHPDANGKLQETRYVQNAETIYQAAEELHSGFKLIMLPEGSVQPAVPNMEDMIRRFAHRPNQFLCQGKVVLAGYGLDGPTVKTVQDDLEREGIQTLFVSQMYLRGCQVEASVGALNDIFHTSPNLDGFMQFSCVGPVGTVLLNNSNGEFACKRLNRIYVAGVCPAYNSWFLSDFHGVRGYGAMWEGAIRDNADWVSIVTWNDFNEDSGLVPYRWPGGAERCYFDRDETFLDLTAYYSAWYKTGVQPPITQDKIYYAYRTRARWEHTAWDVEKSQWIDFTKLEHIRDEIHDNVQDMVYTTAFLTAPAELTVRLGTTTHTTRLPAGVSQVELPMQPGVPEFILRRAVNGGMTVLADFCGRRQIIGNVTKDNSPHGYHLENRNWASGVAVGPVKRLEVASATLHPATTLVHIGNTPAALTTEKAGSGITFPVTGLTTGTYNVRIVYNNPGENDARFNLAGRRFPAPRGGCLLYPGLHAAHREKSLCHRLLLLVALCEYNRPALAVAARGGVGKTKNVV